MKTSEEMSKSVMEKVRAYEVHKAAVRKRVTAVSVTAAALAVCIFTGAAVTGNLRLGAAKAADNAVREEYDIEYGGGVDYEAEAAESVERTGEYSASDSKTNSKDANGAGIGNDTAFCSHEYNYHQIDGWLLDYVDESKEQRFIELFGRTEDYNRRFFMDYYGISKEDYWKIYDKESILADPDVYNIEYYNPDIWFSDDYYKNPLFVQEGKTAPEENSVIIRPEGDTIHTDRYFTICESLIDFVGEEKFNEFRNKYGGTADFNILKFIDEFGISKEDFKKCTETQLLATYGIYNTDYVYGTPEMQKEYFEKHIITK
ncbi:MAG: hypothetical protein IKS04_00905 [Clostridia bacterium]|nr:hypothetical protein [Clostridia bacterium]